MANAITMPMMEMIHAGATASAYPAGRASTPGGASLSPAVEEADPERGDDHHDDHEDEKDAGAHVESSPAAQPAASRYTLMADR
jgi:hypothetical protein